LSLKALGYKPRQATVRVILDDSLRRDVEDARAAYEAQRRQEAKPDQGLASDLPELQKRIDAAEAAADEAAATFVFEAIPRHQIAAFVAECPPKDNRRCLLFPFDKTY
jgi:hypothetical protein